MVIDRPSGESGAAVAPVILPRAQVRPAPHALRIDDRIRVFADGVHDVFNDGTIVGFEPLGFVLIDWDDHPPTQMRLVDVDWEVL